MAEPESLALVDLRELRTDIAALEKRMHARFAAIERRLYIVNRNGEKPLRSFLGYRAIVKRAMAGFEDEIRSLKQRVKRLEAAKA